MKKRNTFFVAVLLSAAIMMVVLAKYVSQTAVASVTPAVSFGVISDTHLTGDGTDAQRQTNLRRALEYFRQHRVDLIVVNGDIAHWGQTAAYEEFNALFREIFPDSAEAPQLLVTADNHEYYQAWPWQTTLEKQTIPELQQRFQTAFGLTDTNNAAVIGGYHFIAVSSDGMDGTCAEYSDDTVSWLRAQLDAAAAENPKRPIYIFVHQPPSNTVCASESSSDSTDALCSIFEDYPQAVVFTSHTHAPLQDERCIDQDLYTVVSTGGLYSACSDDRTYENAPSGVLPDCFSFAQGLLVSAFGDATNVCRYDFFNGEQIKNDWIIGTSCGTSAYVYTAERAQNRALPMFDADASLEVARLSADSCSLVFPAASDADFVHHYVVRVMDSSGKKVLKTSYLITDFYLGLSRMKTTESFTLNGLPAGAGCMISVSAADSFGNESAAITAVIPDAPAL